MNRQQDILPMVLLELSLMRDRVQRFGAAGGDDAARLLTRLSLLESKVRRLIGARTAILPHSLDH